MIVPVLVISLASVVVGTVLGIFTLGMANYISGPVTTAFFTLFGIRTALADLRQTQSAPQTQGERVANTAQQLVGSIYGNLNNQRNEGLGMIDAGRNYRGANVSADDMGRIIYAGQKRKAYDLTGAAYDVQGLNDNAVNNMLSGDDARGTGLAQADALQFVIMSSIVFFTFSLPDVPTSPSSTLITATPFSI